MLKVLLKSTDKYKDTEIEAMINPVDKQNVPLAVKLLDALCGEFDSKNLSPGFQNILPSIKVLSVLCNGVLSLFARPNISIHESLGQLSAMAHMLLFLFGNNDINLPTVLYHDLQSTVQNAYFISAKYKIHCPDMPLYLYQVGSDQLEQLFSSVRTQNHDRGCDIYQLECRILESYWTNYSISTLNGVKDQKDCGPVDHTNPSNWTGNLLCRNLISSISWDWGKSETLRNLPDNYNYSVIEEGTMLKPKGEFIGVKDVCDEEVDLDVVFQCPDNTNEEETALTEFEDDIEERDQRHEITITQNGKEMYKTTALRLITSNKGFRKSNDRLRRVAGLSKFMSKSGNSNSANTNSNDILTLKDTVAALVGTVNGYNLVVVNIDAITDPSEEKLSFCSIDDDGSKITLRGKPLNLEPTNTCSEMQLVWKLGDHNKNKEVKCLLQACAIISPTFEKGVFFFKYNDLQLIFDALKANPAFPLPKSNVTYKSESGEDILRVKLANNESSAGDCSMCNNSQQREMAYSHGKTSP